MASYTYLVDDIIESTENDNSDFASAIPKFVNRADCFLTIHRKVQAPDPHTASMTELHVRKVRETETGGKPTPFDEPFRMIMNTSHTGFIEWGKQKALMAPKVFTGGEQKEIPLDKMSYSVAPNINFLPILKEDEEEESGDQTEQETEPGEV